ncbi:MAG: SIMPL domain-containing protein [Cyclobacteriaceae bacterium]
MKKIFLLTGLLTFQLVSFGQSKNFLDQPYIETSAQVDTLVTPDEIYLNISITEKDTKGKVSVEELEAKMESTLQQLGIDTKKDLTLNDLASNFKKYFLKDQDIQKVKVYTLMVRDAVTAGRVIIELENIEISNVLLDRTEYSKIEDLILNLKSKAVAKARKQAEFLVKPLNQRVGMAIHITDDPNNSIVGQLQGRAAGIVIRGYSSLKSEEFKPADIEFKKIKVETNVSVVFKLEE